jgi:hypothetical protein
MARLIAIAGAALLATALLMATANVASVRAAAYQIALPVAGDTANGASSPRPLRSAQQVRSCSPVVNPYAGSRYEGINLRGIRALRVSCRTARRVVRRAHRRALALTPTPSGIRTFRWRRWTVTGDIRGPTDSYVARARGGKRVRWVF